MQLIILLIRKQKMMIIYRECDIEIDASIGYPEHELMNHYNNLYNKSIEKCMKCMQKKYSGDHFLKKCKVNRTGLITSIRYIVILIILILIIMIVMIILILVKIKIKMI